MRGQQNVEQNTDRKKNVTSVSSMSQLQLVQHEKKKS
jgi:hypothetical protein